jgi:flavin reductase (DIM6/NTAB) family NADH-FMN oxidoreductase RutF
LGASLPAAWICILVVPMQLDFTNLPMPEAYAWMIGTITPRPIAWVSTISADGKTNLAPFSFFQGVTSNPPTLMFVPVDSRDGAKKDTVRNLEQVPEFVVNIVNYALAEKMNATAAPLPYGESEFEKFDIASALSTRVRPPRVAAAPVAFECVLHSIVRIGEGPLAANVVFGRILSAHVDEAILGPDGKPDPAKLDTIGRMGGEFYSRTTERFVIKRPDRR